MAQDSQRRNIEIKARMRDREAVLRAARVLPVRDEGVMGQIDTYFQVPHGRLKLREIDGSRAELIFYLRPDQRTARGSDYRIAPVTDGAALLSVLGAALGVRGRVEKERHVLVYRHTRIHLDTVVGLGEFIELETVLDGVDEEAGRVENAAVKEALGIEDQDLVDGSYGEMGVCFPAAVPTF